MPIEDENEVELALRSDPIVPRPDQRDRYLEVVRRSVERVFRSDAGAVAKRRSAVNEADPKDQEKFYQAEPYSVAADIAGEAGHGTPSQQLEYLKIRRDVGYGDKLEVPPHLWAEAEALSSV